MSIDNTDKDFIEKDYPEQDIEGEITRSENFDVQEQLKKMYLLLEDLEARVTALEPEPIKEIIK